MYKIFKNIALASLLSIAVVGCARVPAGNVGIKINLYGSDKGVDNEELGPGRYWLGWNEELYLFPTFTQNYVWTKDSVPGSETDESISFQSIEGLVVNADVGISYSIDPEKVVTIFKTYRRGVDEITDTFLRNEVRDALVIVASTAPIESVYGAGKAKLIKTVEKMVSERVGAIGIKIDKVYWIGELRLPDSVTQSINAKIAATQKAQQRQNEIQQSRAEADKKIEEARGEAQSIIEVAKAKAEANSIESKSLTPELIRYKMIERWNGQLPTVSSGDNGMLFNLSLDQIQNNKTEPLEMLK